MARPSTIRRLALWANGERVGTWTQPARSADELQYDEAWVSAPHGRPLSLSLPFLPGNEPLRGESVSNWFENLLPDSPEIRRRVARQFSADPRDRFGLLGIIGRDCVGAVQLLPEDEPPGNAQQTLAEPLDDKAVEEILVRAAGGEAMGFEPGSQDDLRISIAGAQEKTALLQREGRWYRPVGATPTTHILKLPLGIVGNMQADFSTSVDNEWLCLKILKAFGLPTADAEIVRFGTQRVLAVERFDRIRSGRDGRILRLPQEDFCQVEGLPSEKRYESQGGPGLKTLFKVLEGSTTPDEDALTLMTAQILFWLLRAPDGHAKNFSLHIQPQGHYKLTPLYDVMSAWPIIGRGSRNFSPRKVKLAMALLGKNKHYTMHDIQVRHFESTALAVGYPGNVRTLLESVAERAGRAMATATAALPSDFSGPVLETVTQGMTEAVDALERQLAASPR